MELEFQRLTSGTYAFFVFLKLKLKGSSILKGFILFKVQVRSKSNNVQVFSIGCLKSIQVTYPQPFIECRSQHCPLIVNLDSKRQLISKYIVLKDCSSFSMSKISYRMIDKVRHISIVTSINSIWTVSIIIIKIKEVGSSNSIIILPSFFCFHICYNLQNITLVQKPLLCISSSESCSLSTCSSILLFLVIFILNSLQ